MWGGKQRAHSNALECTNQNKIKRFTTQSQNDKMKREPNYTELSKFHIASAVTQNTTDQVTVKSISTTTGTVLLSNPAVLGWTGKFQVRKKQAESLKTLGTVTHGRAEAYFSNPEMAKRRNN